MAIEHFIPRRATLVIYDDLTKRYGLPSNVTYIRLQDVKLTPDVFYLHSLLAAKL
jgi:F0F1-type ATP synthase alpha subunit